MRIRFSIIAVILCALVLLVAAPELKRTIDDARRLKYGSAMRSLAIDTYESLAACYKERGQYPASLSNLVYLAHSDEFSQSMLNDLIYESTGTTYILRVRASVQSGLNAVSASCGGMPIEIK